MRSIFSTMAYRIYSFSNSKCLKSKTLFPILIKTRLEKPSSPLLHEDNDHAVYKFHSSLLQHTPLQTTEINKKINISAQNDEIKNSLLTWCKFLCFEKTEGGRMLSD